jgi:hypothetical protein
MESAGLGPRNPSADEAPGQETRLLHVGSQLCLFGDGGEGASELIRTGCRLAVTADTLQTRNYVFNLHPFNQATNTLEVAIAAPGKSNILNNSVFDVEVNQSGAGALCAILIFHYDM